MAMHETPQTELCEDDLQSSCAAPAEAAVSPGEDGELDFRISVRKVHVKVQARGVLAE